jgi:hypothetical protein
MVEGLRHEYILVTGDKDCCYDGGSDSGLVALPHGSLLHALHHESGDSEEVGWGAAGSSKAILAFDDELPDQGPFSPPTAMGGCCPILGGFLGRSLRRFFRLHRLSRFGRILLHLREVSLHDNLVVTAL